MGTFLILMSLFVKFSLSEFTGGPLQVTVEAFERESKAKRFLECKWTQNGQEGFRISFNGKSDEPGTRFIQQSTLTSIGDKKTMEFALRPAAFPHHILGVNGGKLVIKNGTDVEPNDGEYKFQRKRLYLHYTDSNHTSVIERYYVFKTCSRLPSMIKSSRSGRVLLDKNNNWKDGRAWFKVKDAS